MVTRKCRVIKVSVKMAYNVSGLAEGGDFKHKSSIEERKLNLAQMPNRSRSAPLLAIPCWRFVHLSNQTALKFNAQFIYKLKIIYPMHSHVFANIWNFNSI